MASPLPSRSVHPVPPPAHLAPAIVQRLMDARAQTRRVIMDAEWAGHAPLLAEILALKAQRGAVILAHNYQTPEIFYGVADIVGDSLKLAEEAARSAAPVIVMAGVRFMAETAKLLNPGKTVLLPDVRAGCSLAESITGADVRLLRQKYPGVPVVTYVNSTAEVKAESDICITSGNALRVVRSLGVPRILCLPDEYLAHWLQTQLPEVEVIAWKGHCEVHERFTAEDVRSFRRDTPGLVVLAHPECPQDVLREADFVGSTAGMQDYVRTQQPARVVLITECSMSDNVAAVSPQTEFVRPCQLCPHMKRITLTNIRDCLRDLAPQITVDPALVERARAAILRMLAVSA